jgi:hypothetical protein
MRCVWRRATEQHAAGDEGSGEEELAGASGSVGDGSLKMPYYSKEKKSRKALRFEKRRKGRVENWAFRRPFLECARMGGCCGGSARSSLGVAGARAVGKEMETSNQVLFGGGD